jgi:hypothetical protein
MSEQMFSLHIENQKWIILQQHENEEMLGIGSC